MAIKNIQIENENKYPHFSDVLLKASSLINSDLVDKLFVDLFDDLKKFKKKYNELVSVLDDDYLSKLTTAALSTDKNAEILFDEELDYIRRTIQSNRSPYLFIPAIQVFEDKEIEFALYDESAGSSYKDIVLLNPLKVNFLKFKTRNSIEKAIIAYIFKDNTLDNVKKVLLNHLNTNLKACVKYYAMNDLDSYIVKQYNTLFVYKQVRNLITPEELLDVYTKFKNKYSFEANRILMDIKNELVEEPSNPKTIEAAMRIYEVKHEYRGLCDEFFYILYREFKEFGHINHNINRYTDDLLCTNLLNYKMFNNEDKDILTNFQLYLWNNFSVENQNSVICSYINDNLANFNLKYLYWKTLDVSYHIDQSINPSWYIFVSEDRIKNFLNSLNDMSIETEYNTSHMVSNLCTKPEILHLQRLDNIQLENTSFRLKENDRVLILEAFNERYSRNNKVFAHHKCVKIFNYFEDFGFDINQYNEIMLLDSAEVYLKFLIKEAPNSKYKEFIEQLYNLSRNYKNSNKYKLLNLEFPQVFGVVYDHKNLQQNKYIFNDEIDHYNIHNASLWRK